MSFFTSLLSRKKKTESVILIDVGTGSVAGAYVQYIEGELPNVLYTRRFPVEFREGEMQEKAVLRALKVLNDTLIKEGAPVLARATGSGSAKNILVSIDAPWQKTSVRTEYLEQDEPFLFTKSLVAAALKKSVTKTTGKMLVDESIIGTIVNGYETHSPYGKEVHRAEIVVLTSLIDESVAKAITSLLQGAFHTRRVLPIAGSSLRYQAMRKAFPHERDAIIIDATGPLISIALVRKDLFVAIVDITDNTVTDNSWVGEVTKELGTLAKHYPLPRTIFLLAREASISSLQQTLTGTDFGELWLSDNPPKVVAVLASHLTGLVRQVTTAPPDLLLILMTLFWYHHRAYGDKA